MVSYEQIIKQIYLNCHLNNGSAFETSDICLPIYWTKKYAGKKSFFKCQWAYIKSDDDKACKEFESILSKLPNGISYTKKTILSTPLPDVAKEGHTVYERYTTSYTINVSETFSKKIVHDSNNPQIILSTDFDNNTIHAAIDFKNIILSSHQEIIEPLFQHGLQRNCDLTDTGFTNHDNYEFGFQFVGMKPLCNESQRLGLAIVLAEYGVSFLKESQFYYIYRSSSSISVNIRTRNLKKNNLKDW